jgi:transcriptional regulator with GAF, ATPase, and Fis domain
MDTTETSSQAQPLPQSTPTLRLLFCGDAGPVGRPPFPLIDGPVMLGREVPPDQGIALTEDRRASRRHAQVERIQGVIQITDLGSKNGLFVNGGRVTHAALQEGDVIRVGDSLLILRTEPARQLDGRVPGLLGSAPATRALRHALARAAPSKATVLLCGETGTGKEVAARAVHELSGRTGPLISMNCAAIPDSLAESQLFGHMAGAFTGASAHAGFFRAAHEGTLFLDEVGELSPALQPKLLRALEERAVIPVGSTRPIACDVRLVAATNRDLPAAIHQGTFRADLFARLSEVPVALPPLRDRREDVLEILMANLGSRPHHLSADLAAALLIHPWPFNIREVRKLAAGLLLAAEGRDRLEVDLLQGLLRPAEGPAGQESGAPPPPAIAPGPAEAAQRTPAPTGEELRALMAETRGNVSEVARRMGRSRRQVDRWLAQHGLTIHMFRDE